MNDVSTTHPEYDAAEPAQTLCRDVAAGPRAVKGKGELYLPKPPGQSAKDYTAYKTRAPLFGAFPRTITALSGAVFSRRPSVTVPAPVTPQLEDVTLRNESIDDLALKIVEEILTVGRAGLLVDMAEAGGQPYVARYRAESIVNWRTGPVGGDPDQLVQLVLREDVEVPAGIDGFGRTVVPTYRELALAAGDEGPVYQCRVWRRSDPALVVSVANTPWTAGPWLTPTRRGRALPFIPFVFVGPSGITPSISRPPLEDLADLIIQHFRNGADHEEGLHIIALPTPWAAGVQGDADQPLMIGPSVCWRLEKDGKAGMLEFSGAGLAAIREALAAKEKQMAVLGGRLLLGEPHGQAAETATSARLRYSAEAASLRTIAGAVSAALTIALRWFVWWQSVADALPLDVRVDLADEFFQMRASPDEVKTALVAVQAGEMASATFYALLQRGGWTRPGVTAEDEMKAIQSSETRLLGAGNDAA